MTNLAAYPWVCSASNCLLAAISATRSYSAAENYWTSDASIPRCFVNCNYTDIKFANLYTTRNPALATQSLPCNASTSDGSSSSSVALTCWYWRTRRERNLNARALKCC